jgi:predicted phosphate transport protein (TIGR00153 family)
MGFSLLPKEYAFFDMLNNHSSKIADTATILKRIVEKGSIDQKDVQDVRDLEHAADAIYHDIVDKLNKTFITPIDREDILSLAHELDTIIDLITRMTNMMNMYKVTSIDKSFSQNVALIDKSIEAIIKAVTALRDFNTPQPIQEQCAIVNRLEDEGDKLRNELISQLFTNQTDAIYIMKWKDIFQNAEKVLDQCEKVTKIIESILVKQA